MKKRALKQFRFMGIIEGLSLLILLFIAMPLKYLFDMPEVVSVVGAIHGGFVTLYFLMIVYAAVAVRWPFRFSIGAVAVAFIPFGNFILDRRLDRWKQVKMA